MMNCKDVQNMLSVYIDNECTIVEQREMKEHLKDCKSCRDELAWLQTIIDSTRELDEINIPDGFHEDLMHRIHKIQDNSSRIQPFKKRVRPVYSIAAAAFLFVVVFSIFGAQQLIRMSNKSTEMSLESAPYDTAIEEYTTEEKMPDSKEATLKSDEDMSAAGILTAPEEGKVSDEYGASEYSDENGMIVNNVQDVDGLKESERILPVQGEDQGITKNAPLDKNKNMGESNEIDQSILSDEEVEKSLSFRSKEVVKTEESNVSQSISILFLIIFPLITIVLIFRKRQN